MLRLLLLLPVFGALAVSLLPRRRSAWAASIALATTAAALALAGMVAWRFEPSGAAVQFFETHAWNPRLGSAFSLGVDGVALVMVLLTATLFFVAALASEPAGHGAKLYFTLLLLLESAVLGVFMARDWSLFYVFWELTLIPLFFLIERLGGENRHRAALNFVLYTMGGSVFMLVALLVLYDASPAHSFDLAAIAAAARTLPAEAQLWIFAGLAVGFGVKMPIFPLHGWVRAAYVEAPQAVPIVLSGTMAKMGCYGLLRAAETLPSAMAQAAGVLAVLAAANLLYGALLAWRQSDLKAMVAYSSISHMGVVLLGLAAAGRAGITGAVTQMVAHGLVAGLLFLLVGALYRRSHSRELADYGNLAAAMPRTALCLALAFFAAIGLPGSAGFVAEVQVLLAALARWGAFGAVLSLGMLISAAYGLRVIGRLATGPTVASVGGHPLIDLERRETLAAGLLLAGIGILGLHPAPLLNLIGPAAERLAAMLS